LADIEAATLSDPGKKNCFVLWSFLPVPSKNRSW
jgi:hypothetical protein